MTRSSIELLVLDGQGVVFNDPLATFFDELSVATGQEPHAVRTRWRDQVRDAAWRGALDDEAMWRMLGVDGDLWGPRLEAVYAPGPAAPRLAAWATFVPVWLLTNHRTRWIEPRLERFGLRRWLTRVLVSDALGALKPEPAVFAPILAAVPTPEAVLVVDDQEKNVDAAKALGMAAILADPTGVWLTAVDQSLASGARRPRRTEW